MNISSAYPHEETASFLIYRVGRLLRFQAAAFFKERGFSITPEQWNLLLKIAEEPGRPISSLVDSAFNDYPNVTRLVDGLERMGFAVREHNPDDRRSHIVSPTRSGLDFVESVLPCLIEAKSAFYEGLDETDVAALLRILKIMEANLA